MLISDNEMRGFMSIVFEEIKHTRIVGIVRLEHYDNALEVAQALVMGGISVIEFTLTGRGAIDAIKRVRTALGMKGVDWRRHSPPCQ
jgi:2-keto-3-deoxy-6-phosphogluconate aldolase